MIITIGRYEVHFWTFTCFTLKTELIQQFQVGILLFLHIRYLLIFVYRQLDYHFWVDAILLGPFLNPKSVSNAKWHCRLVDQYEMVSQSDGYTILWWFPPSSNDNQLQRLSYLFIYFFCCCFFFLVRCFSSLFRELNSQIIFHFRFKCLHVRTKKRHNIKSQTTSYCCDIRIVRFFLFVQTTFAGSRWISFSFELGNDDRDASSCRSFARSNSHRVLKILDFLSFWV